MVRWTARRNAGTRRTNRRASSPGWSRCSTRLGAPSGNWAVPPAITAVLIATALAGALSATAVSRAASFEAMVRYGYERQIENMPGTFSRNMSDADRERSLEAMRGAVRLSRNFAPALGAIAAALSPVVAAGFFLLVFGILGSPGSYRVLLSTVAHAGWPPAAVSSLLTCLGGPALPSHAARTSRQPDSDQPRRGDSRARGRGGGPRLADRTVSSPGSWPSPPSASRSRSGSRAAVPSRSRSRSGRSPPPSRSRPPSSPASSASRSASLRPERPPRRIPNSPWTKQDGS